MCEQVSDKESDNDDHDDCVDYEGDNVTLEPICFEDVSWTPPILNCDFCDKIEEELFKARRVYKQLESANKKLSAKVLSRVTVMPKCSTSQACSHMKYWNLSLNLLPVDYQIYLLPALNCSVFDQFLLVMMRLRLNLGVQDLGYRFDIHPSTVCRYFSKWLDMLYTKLHCLARKRQSS